MITSLSLVFSKERNKLSYCILQHFVPNNILTEGSKNVYWDILDVFVFQVWHNDDDPNLRPSFENLRKELKEMENQHKVDL